MTKIIDLIPDDAVTVADTAEYTAWKSQDGSEAWISMKEPNAFVTESMLLTVVQDIWCAGFNVEKVTVPDGRAFGVEYGKRLSVYCPTDLYDTDFGIVDIIDLKRNEIDALAEPFIANLKDGIEALGKLFEESGFDNDAGEFLLERARQWLAWEEARNNRAKADALVMALLDRVGPPGPGGYSIEFLTELKEIYVANGDTEQAEATQRQIDQLTAANPA